MGGDRNNTCILVCLPRMPPSRILCPPPPESPEC